MHRNGSVYRFDLQKMFAGSNRKISLDQLIDHAVENGWLVANGSRVSPGELEPELETSARYTAVAGDGLY